MTHCSLRFREAKMSDAKLARQDIGGPNKIDLVLSGATSVAALQNE